MSDPIFKLIELKPTKSTVGNATGSPTKPVKTTVTKTVTATQQEVPKKTHISGQKISIKQKNQEKSHDEHIISQVDKPREEYDHEKLGSSIEEYAKTQEKNNRKSWAFTLKAGEPIMKENDVIVFTLFNKSQEVEFNKNREDFTQYLRDKLNNQYITIKSELKEKEEVHVKTIDPAQKFENMVKENPVLEELKKTFGLDV